VNAGDALSAGDLPPVRARPGLLPARRGQILAALLLAAGLALLVLPPIGYVLGQAFAEGGSGFRNLAGLPGLGRSIANTVLLGLGSVAIALVVGVYLARCAIRLPRGLRWLAALPLLPLVMPPLATIVGWAFLLAPRVGFVNVMLRELPFFADLARGPVDIYTVPWIVIITGVLLASYAYMFIYVGLLGMGQDVSDASRIAGASERQTFWMVVLPLLRPQLVYAGAVVLLLALGQFTAPLLLGSPRNINVLTTEMFWLMQRIPVRFGDAAALGALLIILGVMLALTQRRLVGETARFVSLGGTTARTNTRTSAYAALPILGYGLIALVLPLAGLARVALSSFWSSRIFAPVTFENFRSVLLDNPETKGAILTTIFASAGATAIVLPIGLAAALVSQGANMPKFVKDLCELFVFIPLGVPAAIFGAGFLFAFAQGPFPLAGTTLGLIVVYVTITIPFATRVTLAALNTVSKDYAEAARVCGAGSLRAFGMIVLPLLRPGLAAAAVLVLVVLSHELAASLFVRSPSTQVMSTVLYDGWATGSYPDVAVIALIMFAVTTTGIGIAALALRPPTRRRARGRP